MSDMMLYANAECSSTIGTQNDEDERSNMASVYQPTKVILLSGRVPLLYSDIYHHSMLKYFHAYLEAGNG